MIESLKKSLEAHPDNPFLQGHVEALTAAEKKRNARRSAATCSPWNHCSDVMPDLGQIVWLYDAVINTVWLGSREDDVDGWMWGNAYGTVWHNGEKWDADVEIDDDYTPTHWLALPSLPNVPVVAPATLEPESKNDVVAG